MELEADFGDNQGFKDLCRFFDHVNAIGLGPVCRFNSSILRGLDYYTGIVFEIYDKHPDNRRALFGGGRYDNLVGMFGGEQIPGVGFGMGDVTLVDFLETHGILPENQPTTDVLVGLFDDSMFDHMQQIARQLRQSGLNVETVLSPTKLGKQFQNADKQGIPVVIMVGPDEAEQAQVTVKHLKSGVQETMDQDSLLNYLHSLLR